jgi:hypothetical protein
MTGDQLTETDQDIVELNFSYLMKIREMARTGHAKKALLVFGISQHSINRIGGMSLDALREVSRTGLLCYKPRCPDKFWKELSEKAEDKSLDNVRNAHMLLMIAGGSENGDQSYAA